MILIDSLYINNSGGKVLLDYLVAELEKTKSEVFYLFDSRVKNDYSFIPEERKIYLKASVINRFKFYKQNKNRYKKILCFGNIPPFNTVEAQIFVYFHQVLYLSIPQNTPLKKRILLKLKSLIINIFKKNADYWLVQSETVKTQIAQKYRIIGKNIKIVPFFPPLEVAGQVTRKKNSYLYVSNGNPHKNHERLINAFSKFSRNSDKNAELHLTVSEAYPNLIQQIEQANQKGAKIINHGLVKREKLGLLYKQASYLVYPSLRESFGLGIIEGIESGCKIIGADLPYTYAVCEPSIIFNPLSVDSIKKALQTSAENKVPESKQKVFNEIEMLIDILK